MIVMKYSLSRLALLCSLACCALLLEPASTRASTLLLTADKNFWQVSETHLSVTDKLPGDADLAAVMDEGVPWKPLVDRSPVPVLEGKGKTIWGHFQLTNPRKTAVSIHAVIRYSFLERIDWYWQDGSGQIVHKLGGQRTPVGAGEGPSRFPMIEFVLQAVADRLRKLCESSGDAFRTGGDEFIVLCHRRTRKEDVEALAARIVEEVSLPIEFNGDTLRVGASVGVAYPLEGRDNILNAIDEADAALYQAKARGKGQVAAAASFGGLAHNRRRGDNA